MRLSTIEGSCSSVGPCYGAIGDSNKSFSMSRCVWGAIPIWLNEKDCVKLLRMTRGCLCEALATLGMRGLDFTELAAQRGLEPRTKWLTVTYSTIELLGKTSKANRNRLPSNRAYSNEKWVEGQHSLSSWCDSSVGYFPNRRFFGLFSLFVAWSACQ